MSNDETRISDPGEGSILPDETRLERTDATVDLRTPTQIRLARQAVATSFVPEQIVADRFRIVRFIAKGGMGEVYEAEDLELKEHVALKTVLPDIALDKSAIKRFTREIALSRKVTHPNACRIFDLFHHLEGDQDTVLLSMELLDGIPLSDHIRDKGPVPLAEALPLIHQMAGALSAAHHADIVHRDFKPNNVILVPAPSFPNGIRAVVTDFGLAMGVGQATSSVTVSSTGEGFFVGTPAYMAPEQVQGKAATRQSDIYAFGLVLFEMITGQVAFTGTNPLTVATMRLTEPPPAPERLVPALDPVLRLVIHRCLERDPAQRWQRMDEILEALGAGSRTAMLTLLPGQLQQAARKSRKPIFLAAGAVGLLAVGGVTGFLMFRADTQGIQGLAGITGQRPSLAVLALQDLKASAPWLAPALSQMLATELAAGERLRVLPSDLVTQTCRDLGLASTAQPGRETLTKLYTNLGTDFLVSGSFLSSGTELRVDLHLLDAKTGESLLSAAESGTEADLAKLVSRLGQRFREKLRLKEAASRDNSLGASLPRNMEAARCYSLGLEKLALADPLAGKDWLQKATQLEPTHALSHAAYGRAWNTLGYQGRALEELVLARQHYRTLSRKDRALIDAQFFELNNERSRAIEIHQQLHAKFPDDPEVGKQLIRNLRLAGRGPEALGVLASMRKIQGPAASDPQWDNQEAQIHSAMGQAARQKEASARAARAAEERGQRRLAAEALLQKGDACIKLGERKEAREAFETSRDCYLASGDEAGTANARAELAWLAHEEGRYEEARLTFEESLAVFKRLGKVDDLARIQNNMAAMEYGLERLEGARTLFQAAFDTYQEAGRKVEMATALNNIANVQIRAGQYRETLPVLHEALSLARGAQNKGQTALVLSSLGQLRRILGGLTEAEQHLIEAQNLCREVGDRDVLSFVQAEFALLALIQDDAERAGRLFEDSIASRRQLGLPAPVIESADMAQKGLLKLETGHVAEAAELLRKGAEMAQSAGNPESERDSRLNGARAFMELGKPAEAEKLLAPMKAQLLKSVAFETRSRAQLLDVALRAPRQPEPSAAAIRAIADEAGKRGILPLQFEAQIALARLLGAQGRHEEASALLDRLKAEATAKGFRHFARRAEVIRG